MEKISEASESTLSRTRSDNTTRKSLAKPLSNEDASIRTEISGDIDEQLEIVEDSVSDRSGLLQISKELPPLTKSPREEYEATYTEDFTEEPRSASVQLPLSEVSDHTEPKRTYADNISEHISEIVSAEDSQFIRPLDLHDDIRQEQPTDDGYLDQKSPRSSYSTTRTDSRPSSGRSQSSQNLNGSFDDSDVEPSQTSSVPPGPGDLPSRPGEIVNLMGFDDEEEIDEETPIASPRDGITTEMDIMGDFNIGDRVLVTGPRGARSPGTLLFKGKVTFAPGIWAGVELESADGRNDGSHESVRYFTCRPGHGVLVPGDDLMPAPAARSPRRSLSHESTASPRDDESVTTDEQEENDLSKAISEADKNVWGFDDSFVSPKSDRSQHEKEALTDGITDQILADVVKKDMSAISEIQDRKLPPVVAPKPAKTTDVPAVGTETSHMNGDMDSDGERDINQNDKRTQMTEKLTKNLLSDAIEDMITIRNKQRRRLEPLRAAVDYEEFNDMEPAVISPTEETDMRWRQEDQESALEMPPRPVSPLPGSTSRTIKVRQFHGCKNALYNIQNGELLPYLHRLHVFVHRCL